jgi:hypothetical protein
MKKYKGGARSTKKNNKKKMFPVKKYTMKKADSKEKRLQANLKKLVENPDNSMYSYEKILRKFEKFFKGILKLEDKLYYSNNTDAQNEFDMKKFEIADKLQALDDENGKLMTRIKKLSPDIYNKITNELNSNIESSDIIELYANVIEVLVDFNDELYTNTSMNARYESDLSMVSSILSSELVTEFLEVKKNTKSVEDELVDMFRGFSIKKNNSSVEDNISKILANLKL